MGSKSSRINGIRVFSESAGEDVPDFLAPPRRRRAFRDNAIIERASTFHRLDRTVSRGRDPAAEFDPSQWKLPMFKRAC
jgi:hypothetical protein